MKQGSKIKRDMDPVIVPITMTHAIRRFALQYSKLMPGCPRPEQGSISHFFNYLAKEKARSLGIKEDWTKN